MKKTFKEDNNIQNNNGKDNNNELNLFNKKYNQNINIKNEKIIVLKCEIENKGMELLSKNNFTNLHTLNLSNCKITKIDCIVNFKKLSKLILCCNFITDITPLEKADLVNLNILDLGDNNLSDLLPLTKCNLNKLKNISFNDNDLTDITPLYNCNFFDIEDIFLYHNYIDFYSNELQKFFDDFYIKFIHSDIFI